MPGGWKLTVHRHNDNPIFVVGAPRSGTTLLQRMLRSHPRISSPTGESHFIIPLEQDAAAFGDLKELASVKSVMTEMYRRSTNFLDTDFRWGHFDLERFAAEFHAEGRDSIPKIVDGLYEKNARIEGKSRWLDKTPYYVLHMPTVLEMFPDAQIIHIVRDGRDVALSLFGRKHDFRVHTSYGAAKYWKLYVDVGQEVGTSLPKRQYLEVQYEELIRDPVKTVKRICDFLKEEFAYSMIDFEKSTDERSKTPLLARPLLRDNFEKWRDELTWHQIKTFERVAGDTLARNGYALLTDARPMSLPVRGAYRIHNWIVTRIERNNRK